MFLILAMLEWFLLLYIMSLEFIPIERYISQSELKWEIEEGRRVLVNPGPLAWEA